MAVDFAQVIPVFRALHVYRESIPVPHNCSTNEVCAFRKQSAEVWLDHMDELSSIPRRGFHSAFEDGDPDGTLGMKPWSTIYEGISRGGLGTFTLLFVFGGMEMLTAEETNFSIAVMHSQVCSQHNQRVLNAFRKKPAPLQSVLAPQRVQQHPSQQFSYNSSKRVLVISRDGTWWRRWLNEKVRLAFALSLRRSSFKFKMELEIAARLGSSRLTLVLRNCWHSLLPNLNAVLSKTIANKALCSMKALWWTCM
jgi:hypothetical protein